ncbi:MAG: DUF2163 domain-containing protein [Candidatus Zixiibacteriota bacterium]|nr:MAG: DUF2163 domain-containing protein [candidate division Zixibacteria bacterium]
MTFEAFETSDGRPVELLTFINGALTFNYTNANTDVIVGATTYTPLEYTRTAPSLSKDSDDGNVKITIPHTNPVALLYREILQSNITSVTIQRFHDNDPAEQVQVFWKGEIGSVATADSRTTILAIPLSQGQDEIPRFTYQSLCNYFLFDSGTCRIVRDDFRFVATITSIDSTGRFITINGLRTRAGVLDAGVSGALSSAELDEYWLNGYCLTGDGELRRVVKNPAGISSPLDPDTIEIPYPFVSASASDVITVFSGCKRDTDICVRKYDNIINYGGWPTVPEVNPFTTELPKGSRSSDSNFTRFS